MWKPVLAAMVLCVSCAQMTEHRAKSAARATPLSEDLRAKSSAGPLVIAHRGASFDHPENTMPAFQAALDAGTDLIELDFRATADGILVVIHDETLDRTTDSETVLARKDAAVESLSLDQMRDVDAGSWKHARFAGTTIPTLEDALTLIQPRAVTLLERKAGTPRSLVELLRRMKLVDAVVVSSFDWPWLSELHRLEPRITIAALCHDPVASADLDQLAATGASLVHWNWRRLAPEDVADLHARGYLVCAYTLNADIALLGGCAVGLDGITTDRPARLRELRG